MAKAQFVIGNWKMYKTGRQATDYMEALIPAIEGTGVSVYLAVPFTSIAVAAQYARGSSIVIGAQNMNDAREGAFTGEIASLMLKEAGAAFVLLGHSERRIHFGEDNALIHKKLLRALKDDIQPILCVGETKEAHAEGRAHEVLQKQLLAALQDIPAKEAEKVIIAYEPVWAVGSGKTPTAKEIEGAHSFIRSLLTELLGKKVGDAIPILYGGSVKPENASEIAGEKNVDGLLVGGASLDPETMAQIILNIGAPKKRGGSRIKKEKKP